MMHNPLLNKSIQELTPRELGELLQDPGLLQYLASEGIMVHMSDEVDSNGDRMITLFGTNPNNMKQ